MKLNTDGAWRSSDRAAVGGGLVRDKNGKWLWGYTRSLGRCSVLEAELWQILDGLDLLWKHGYRNIVVESNNAAAVRLLMNEGNTRQGIAVAHRIRSILDRQWTERSRHCFRQANAAADFLAKSVEGNPIGFRWLEKPPVAMEHFFFFDFCFIRKKKIKFKY